MVRSYRISVLLAVVLAVLITCCNCLGGCDCSDIVRYLLTGSYSCSIDTLNRQVGGSSTAQAQTVEITDGTLHLGPAEGPRAAQQTDDAAFWGNRVDGPVLMMSGTYTEDGNDVTVNLTPTNVAGVAEPQSITMHLTSTSTTQASGTIQYVESGYTYQGDITIERYPDQ